MLACHYCSGYNTVSALYLSEFFHVSCQKEVVSTYIEAVSRLYSVASKFLLSVEKIIVE